MAVLGCVVGLVASATTGTQSSWTSGQVRNGSTAAVTATMSFVHDYPASPDTCALSGPQTATVCSGSIWPTSAAGASPVVKNDAIADQSTVPAGTSMYAQGQVMSCGPVQLANAKDSTNPLLPRYTVDFRTSDPWSGTNAVQLDGSQSYAAAVRSESSVPSTLLSAGGTAGYGIWFKTTTTAGGPIFAFDSDPASAGGTRDKVLYMDTAGRLGFVFSAAGSTTGMTTSSYNNGVWHFAYARISVVSALGIPVTSTSTLYVDGSPLATSSTLLGASGSGYFHLGWAPISGTSYGSGLSNYFAGTVSNAVIFLGGSAPAAGATPATQAAFDAFASTATHQYTLGDSGTTTFDTGLPYVSGGDPCADVTLSWTAGSSSIFATSTLKALATAGWSAAVAAPAPGASQTSLMSYARAGSYDADVSGLHLYAPMAYRVGLTSPPATGWSLTFTWSGDANAVFLG